ncbi:hypothetical protein AUK40_04375 [Candidatus Wirthbacteria bacterium CG2_30_54_11]|uniref:Segregation and condensation protein A n=1 Tax=Candidatus Wirthbacteria bacterium CG2_30_54_11 TaxID=1817892 RepID=A0A1J5IUR3_9BACT|nr:MAG: hypothetical protein AUK40_04375 [Candidatus Wirthbacteria bacterium CG2_30_54_11]
MATIKLPAFEGTLEALVEKVKKHEIKPLDLDLSEIVSQLKAQSEDDLAQTTDALVFLSSLVARKSKALLPLEEEEAETENLEQSIEDFESYKQLTLFLDQLEERDEPSFTRHMQEKIEQEIDVQHYLEGVDFGDLSRALHEVLEKFKLEKTPLGFDEQVEREQFTVELKIVELRTLLSKTRKSLSFAQLFAEARTKIEIIVTFLAMLELIKQREISVRQERKFGPIVINRK